MAIWSLIAKQIPRLVKKGFDKSQIRKKISEMPEFANDYSAFFKTRKGEGSNYAGTFDKAWNSLKLPAVDPKVSGAKAGKTAWENRYADPEAYAKYVRGQRRLTKEQVKKGLKTKHPDTGEMGYHSNPVYQKIINAYNAGFQTGTPSYRKAQEAFAKEWGKGSITKVANDKDFAKAWHMRRQEAQEFVLGELDELTPASEILSKYKGKDWAPVIAERDALRNLIFKPKRGTIEEELYPFLKDEMGLSSQEIVAGVGHDYFLPGITGLRSSSKVPNMLLENAMRLVNDPANIRAELNFMNMSKARGIEPFLWQPEKGYFAKDIPELDELMKLAQVRSKFYSPVGTREQIGTLSQETDPRLLLEYLKKVQKDVPFDRAKKSGRIRYLPVRDYIMDLLEGKKKFNFQAGGLVGLGSRILKKLAKKLSRQEFKMMMGS